MLVLELITKTKCLVSESVAADTSNTLASCEHEGKPTEPVSGQLALMFYGLAVSVVCNLINYTDEPQNGETIRSLIYA